MDIIVIIHGKLLCQYLPKTPGQRHIYISGLNFTKCMHNAHSMLHLQITKSVLYITGLICTCIKRGALRYRISIVRSRSIYNYIEEFRTALITI